MSTISYIVCDKCKEVISDDNKELVDASVYGFHFHISCFMALDAWGTIEALGIDDITFGPEQERFGSRYGQRPVSPIVAKAPSVNTR